MNEYANLINNYLCINPNIYNNGFYAISFDDLNRALHSLVPFEKPDMYAELEDKIIFLEHFEFDASHEKRKSMIGKEAESRLKKKMRSTPPDSKVHIEKPEYDISFDDWQKNFNRCFGEHYKKIDSYKDRIREVTESVDKGIVTGFLIENQYVPYVQRKGKKICVLPYVVTVQFSDVFKNSPDVDFVLYAYYDRGPKIIYLDHTSLENTHGLVDLNDKDVELSMLNKNEVVFYGGFEIGADCIN